MNESVCNVKNYVPGAVYIGRNRRYGNPIFGNPFKLNPGDERGSTIAKYAEYLRNLVKTDPEFAKAIEGLRGKVLACHCHPLPCHGDEIIRFLRETETRDNSDERTLNEL